MNDPILEEALRLQAMGLSIIPIGRGKKPAMKEWKSFQTSQANEQQIIDWFDRRDDLGLAIVLGPPSAQLVARDFDDPESYRKWATSNPFLATTLPTVRSSRGMHVYACILDCPSRRFTDGELRARGQYIVVPPSTHPTGRRYQWVMRFESLADVPTMNLHDSGFGIQWLNPKERKKRTGATDRTKIDSVQSVLSVETFGQKKWNPNQDRSTTAAAKEEVTDSMRSVRSVLSVENIFREKRDPNQNGTTTVIAKEEKVDSVRSVASVLSVAGVFELIEQTLPTGFGTRRKQLFHLARGIYADSNLKQIPLCDMKPLVREWHRRALPEICTKPFDETWADFVEAYGNVDPSRCRDFTLECVKQIAVKELPPEARNYEDLVTRRLIALCAELSHRSPDRIFYLSCRKAASALGVTDFKQIARYLKMLCTDGVLIETEHGGPHSNRASRYRYVMRGEVPHD